MAETPLVFKVSKGSLVYAAHEKGDVALADSSDLQRLDLVCHMFVGSRSHVYQPLVVNAAAMWQLLQEVQAAMDGRKPIGKSSKLGKSISTLVGNMQAAMS